MNPETFTLDLGDGTRITARVNVAEIASLSADKLPSVVAFNWEGPRQLHHWPRYLAWVKTVWQYVADHAGKSICSLMQPPKGQPFFVVYEPHKAPETVALPRR